MVKLRLQRKGRKKSPFYFIVAAHSSSPRDGKFIQKIGTYSPLTIPARIEIDRDKALTWISNGAQPTNTVKRILSFKGVLYWKHLQRGVSLGLFDLATAEQRYQQWVAQHEVVVKEKHEKHKKHKEQVKLEAWQVSSSAMKIKQEEKAKSLVADVPSETAPAPDAPVATTEEEGTAEA